jgi:hypothetical protein
LTLAARFFDNAKLYNLEPRQSVDAIIFIVAVLSSFHFSITSLKDDKSEGKLLLLNIKYALVTRYVLSLNALDLDLSSSTFIVTFFKVGSTLDNLTKVVSLFGKMFFA